MTPKNQRLRITHDGSLSATNARVVDAETGESVPWVQRVEIVLDPREPPRAFVYALAPQLDVTVEAEISPHDRNAVDRIAEAVVARIQEQRTRLVDSLERLNQAQMEWLKLELEGFIIARLAYITKEQ